MTEMCEKVLFDDEFFHLADSNIHLYLTPAVTYKRPTSVFQVTY